MPDSEKTRAELAAELEAARRRIAELEADREAKEQAQAALRANEALLQAMLRNLPFDFWARDAGERVIMQSDESIRLWGDLSSVLIEDTGADREIVDSWRVDNKRGLAGEVLTSEREYAPPGGERRTYHKVVAPIRDGSNILGIVGVNIDVTERRRAELALQDAHAFLDMVLNSIPDPIFVEDEEHRFVLVNQALCTQLGHPAEYYLGKTVRDILPPGLTESKWADTASVLATGKECVAEERVVNAQGRLLDIITKKVRYVGSGGEKLVIGTTRDITDSKRAEEALRASEERYSTIVRTAAEGICVLDGGGRITLVNQAMADILGCGIEDAVGRAATDFVFPGDIHDFDARLRTRMAGSSVHYERHVRRADGSGLWAIVSATPIFDKDGEFQGSFAMFTDINERKQAEAELARQKRLLSSIIESTSDAVFIKDCEGRYLLVNQVTARLFGKPPCQVLGLDDTAFFPPEQAAQIRSNDLDILGEDGPRTVEERLTTSTGDRVYLATKGPLYDESGRKTGLFGIARDITEREQMAETLIQTEKMASVGGLAAGMAHEINNPLAGIMQSAQVVASRLRPGSAANMKAALECGCDLDRLQAYLRSREIPPLLDGIRDAGKRASMIVANMLDFSKRHASALIPLDLNEVVGKAIELCEHDYSLSERYDMKNVRIVSDFEAPSLIVPCSGNQIQQVLLNLLQNAVQAMSAARTPDPSIVLRTRTEGGHAVVEVEDNGPGMEEEVRRRVFEPFYTTKAPNRGTGLGLSVSYFLVVNRHHGAIEVHSTPGKGTRFVVQLPLKPLPAP